MCAMGQKSLRQILTGVTFIGLIPMAFLLVLLIYRGQAAARDSATAALEVLTASLSSQFDLLISDAEFQFESLNGVDQISSGNSAACNAWMAQNIPKKPGVNTWYRVTTDGMVTCASRDLPLNMKTDSGFNLDDPGVYDRIRIAPARTSKTNGDTVIGLAKAYWNDGNPYQIITTLDAAWFYDAVLQFGPMDDRSLYILDDAGRIILQLPEYEKASGGHAPSFQRLISLQSSPIIHNVEAGVNGDKRVVSSMILHKFGDGRTFTLSISASPNVLFSKARDLVVLGLGAIFLGGLGVIWAQKLLFRRYLARPIQSILEYAQAGEKDGATPEFTLPPQAPSELADLGSAIAKMLRDKTGRAEALSEALSNLERAEDIAKMGHWRLDLKTQELRWSDGVYKLHGLTREGFTPSLENAIDLYHPEDRAVVQQATEDSITQQKPYEFEKRIIRADGTYLYVGARGQVTLDADGAPATMFGIVIDVDAPKQAQRELQRAKVAAQQLADARATFLATVTHEVRTPLAAMLGIVEGFKTPGLTPEQDEQVDLLDASGQLLMNVICDLLDSASVDAGSVRLVEVPSAPQAIIKTCFATFKTAYETDAVSFYHETQGEEPADILLDQQRLRQVIFNILGNAVKHTSSGRIGIETVYGEERFSIAIRDTGPGIASADQSRIFDRFVEGVAPSSGQTHGTGLGLYIVKTLVTNMGGTVHVTSQRGEGSCFTVDLPYRRADAAPQAMPPAKPRQIQRRHGDILVVEDNPVNQKLITAFLKRAGFTFVVQNDGQFAVEWLLSQPADALPPVALIDVNMPRLNGIELCEFIRQQLPGGENMPLYLVTADVLAGYESEMKRLSIDGSVSKPIDFAALKKIIENHVTQQSIESAA